MNRLKKKVAVIILVGFLVISLSLIIRNMLAKEFNNEEVVATVGSKKMTKVELYEYLLNQSSEQDLEEFVANEIIKQESHKLKLDVTDKEINVEYDRIVAQYGGEKQLAEQLRKDGSSLEILKSDLKTYLITSKLVAPTIKITEEQIEAYFNEHKEKYQQKEKVQASHILLTDKSKAEHLYKTLKGKDFNVFSSTAVKESEDEETAKNGGKLGFFDNRQMDEAFTKVAFHTKVGKMSEPVQSAFGWHLIYVTAKQEKKEVLIDVARAEIEQDLIRLEFPQAYAKWLATKKKEYKVEVNDF